MHELSIATSLVSIATQALADADETRPVTMVKIRIGELAGVVIEALEFAWDVAIEDTRCAGARLEIERVPARVRCAACQVETDVGMPPQFVCRQCHQPTGEVVAGRELDLTALEIDDGSEPCSAEDHHETPHS